MANIGANPSTADEKKNDPTIRKDIGFAERLGFGGLLKMNVGAFRATNPKDWYKAIDPFGPRNTPGNMLQYIYSFPVEMTAVAWGRCIGKFAYRGKMIADAIPDLWCFGRTKDGTPRHTLMLPYTTEIELYKDVV
jgi:hypothetical protein